MPRAKNLLLFLTVAVATFYLGVVLSPYLTRAALLPSSAETNAIEKREDGFTFINPLLECEQVNSQGANSLKDISIEVEKVIKANPDESISVYYRDLSNGPWYGYNEAATFAPQSLFKVPLAVAYSKYLEDDPSIITKKIMYTGDHESNLSDEDSLVAGEAYEVQYLIERALKLSDNAAYNLLFENLPQEYMVKTHQDLGVTLPYKDTPEDFITVKEYSALFRILFNSSYLHRENSEYLLYVLSQTTFKEGLVAGVPNDVVVSHKYGILNKPSTEIKQLHDCGIIFSPKKPYILCVMTKGRVPKELEKTIEDISRVVYKTVQDSD